MPVRASALRLFARLRHNRRGATAAIFTIMLPALAGSTGFAIDISYMYAAQSRLQVTADAAALAAAANLSNAADMVARAQAIAGLNAGSDTLAAADIEAGKWNKGSQEFTPGGSNPDAVRVTTRYAASNGNPHQLLFGGILGMPTTDIAAQAVATKGAPACVSNVLLYPDPFVPTRSSVSTLGGPCTGSCPAGFLGPNGFLQTPEGHPIIRLDVSAADFAANPNKTLTVRAGSAVNETYKLPRAGRWFVVVTSYTNPYDIEDPTTKTKPKTNLVYAQWSGGTATWSNNIRGTMTLTQPAECPAGVGSGGGGSSQKTRLVD